MPAKGFVEITFNSEKGSDLWSGTVLFRSPAGNETVIQATNLSGYDKVNAWAKKALSDGGFKRGNKKRGR